MVKLKNGFKKILAVVLIASVCGGMPIMNTYAQEPSGPAGDTQIAENSKKATGPGAQEQAGQNQTGENQTGQNQAGENQAGQEQTGENQAGQNQAGQDQTGQNQAEQNEAGQADQQEIPSGENQTPQEPQNPEENTDGKVMRGGRLIDPSKPMIALTFDDGPYAPVGNRIMDALERHNGRATFFVVGNRVAQYKTEIKRMQDNGHEVGNHTYEHKNMSKLSAAEIRSQIARCNEAVAAVTGVSPKVTRMPGGNYNSTVTANVNYPIIMWNIDTLDWKTKNAQKTINSVIGKVQDGDIVLMHELYTASADAAETIIAKLSEQGYQLVTVSEMAEFRGGMSPGKIYNKFRP